MFGHVKGAFTDARETRIGRFELADQGSLFLDEIGNIPLSQQSKLLRVLENQEFEKVGASKTQKVDARIIAATNADMDKMIKAGLFRQDLFYRFNTFIIHIPPLRDRVDDIEPLAQHYLALFSHKYQKEGLYFSTPALEVLKQYSWPGNIREFNHIIERAVVLAANQQITPEQLSLVAPKGNEHGEHLQTDDNAAAEAEQSLEQLEKAIIARRILHHGGNMLNAAKSLGLSRSAFYRRIDKLEL